MNWIHNEWQGDEKWDDTKHATIEALRAIAEELEKLYSLLENYISIHQER